MQLFYFTTPTLGCDNDHRVISSFLSAGPRLLKPRSSLCLVFDTVVVVVAVVVVIYHSRRVMVVERCYTRTFDFITLFFSSLSFARSMLRLSERKRKTTNKVLFCLSTKRGMREVTKR